MGLIADNSIVHSRAKANRYWKRVGIALLFAVCAFSASSEQSDVATHHIGLSFLGYLSEGSVDVKSGSADGYWPAVGFGQEVVASYRIITRSGVSLEAGLQWNRLPFDIRYDFPAEENSIPDDIYTNGLPIKFATSTLGLKLNVGYQASFADKHHIHGYGQLGIRNAFGPKIYLSRGTFYPHGFSDTTGTFQYHRIDLATDDSWIPSVGGGFEYEHTINKYHSLSLGIEISHSFHPVVEGTASFLVDQPAERFATYENAGNYRGLRITYRYQILPWD